mgnify:CR=1 FL=1
MERIEGESFGFFCPGLTDELVGRGAFETLGEVVGADEVSEMTTEFAVGFVVEAFDGRVFDRAVHPFDLPVSPRMPGLGETVVDVVSSVGRFEGVSPEELLTCDHLLDLGYGPTGVIGEVDAVVREHGVNPIGNGFVVFLPNNFR